MCLYLLHSSAAAFEDRPRSGLLVDHVTDEMLGTLGLDMSCISAALHSVAKQKLFNHKQHGPQADGKPMPHLWADEAEDKDFQPSLEKAMAAARAVGDAGTAASTVTTLRLLLAALAGHAIYIRKVRHIDVAMELAHSWHAGAAPSHDWVEQLVADWLSNTTFHRHWKIERWLSKPMVASFLEMAARSAMMHFRLLIFIQEWRRVGRTENGRINRDDAYTYFVRSVPEKAAWIDPDFCWQADLCSIYHTRRASPEDRGPSVAQQRRGRDGLEQGWKWQRDRPAPSKTVAVVKADNHGWLSEAAKRAKRACKVKA